MSSTIVSYKLRSNHKRLQHIVYERYYSNNEIYVINGSINHNHHSSSNSIRNNNIIIPSIECLANCIQLLSSSLLSLPSLSSSILLILSSSLNYILDSNSVSYAYQKTLKSCLLESPMIATMIFFNQYCKGLYR